MESGAFLRILYRHRFTLIIIPLAVALITYFLVRNQPDTYFAETQIATGIVDKSQQALSNDEMEQESAITQDFDNLIAIMRSKIMLDQVSYQLMIHDLTSATPFKKPSKLFLQLNEGARVHALAVYTDFYNKRKELSLYNPDQIGLYNLLVSMKYDDASLADKLLVYRDQTSDFINIDYTGESGEQSAFVVNTLAHEFIAYYTSVVKGNQQKAIDFLANLTKLKKDTLDAKIDTLKNYKIKERILSIQEQSRALYTQIADYESHLEQAQRDAVSSEAAIKSLDAQMSPSAKKYAESLSVPINANIVSYEDQLRAINERYVQSNLDDVYKRQIDSVQHALTEKIAQSSDAALVSPLATQQSLIQQRLTLEIQYQLAKNSIGTLQEGVKRLNDQLDGIVPHEAVVQQLESAIDVAQKEYLDILNKYNQVSLDANYTNQLKQLEVAMPGAAQPSKKIFMVIISGIVTFVFIVLVLFLIAFFDNTIKTPQDLANRSGAPVLGYLNLLTASTIDLRKVWTDPKINAETYQFRNLLQSIRFEVDNELAGNKILLINSLANGEGKTFLATNLAYAYSLVNKKVLLIDGNFHHPGITNTVKEKIYVEDYLEGTSPDFIGHNNSRITVLSNKGSDGSLLELGRENVIKEKFDKLKQAFDIIIIEASSLSTLNKSKEWTKYSDKILAVFEADKSIRDGQKKHLEYLKNINGKFMGWVLNVVYEYNDSTAKIDE